MSIATYTQLRASAGTLTEARSKSARELTGKDLFLSHSHEDSEHVRPALGLLEKHGAHVYVDIQDAAVKTMSGIQIAARVRNAISECQRLVVVVTEKTRSSRCIPWEMGLADGMAGMDRVALLPLKPSASTTTLWVNQSYFSLYSRIEYVILKNDTQPCWAVRNPTDRRYWRLRRWFERTQSSRR